MGILSDILQKILAAPHPEVAQAPDVEAILNGKARQAVQPMAWRSSIVDLLALLEIGSGLQTRQQLARELLYAGDAGNPASMNIWLHRQVMNKLAQHGGKVPADLRD